MKWIIVFSKAKNIGIWKWFTMGREDYSHVFAVRYDVELDCWFRLEFASERMNFEAIRGDEADLLFAHMMSNCICVDVEVGADSIYFPRWLYCVSFVKHIIGCNKWWILTPYQLYCELIKNNGQILFSEKQET